MFDIGWAELMVIGVVILFVMGPEDIPKLMYQLGRAFRRVQYMRYAMSNQFEDFMKQAESKAEAKEAENLEPVTDDHPNEEDEADLFLLDDMPVPDDVKEVDITDHPDEDDNEETKDDEQQHAGNGKHASTAANG